MLHEGLFGTTAEGEFLDWLKIAEQFLQRSDGRSEPFWILFGIEHRNIENPACSDEFLYIALDHFRMVNALRELSLDVDQKQKSISGNDHGVSVDIRVNEKSDAGMRAGLKDKCYVKVILF